MIHSKSLKRAVAFLMVIVIMFVTIFTDNVVKRVLVRAGDNVEAGSGSDGEDANPSANPSAAPSAKPDEGTGEDETQYPVLGEDINNSATYCNNSNGEINILLDLDKLSDDAVKAEIENAGDIAGVKYKINNTEYDAVKKNDNDNKKWIITIPAYAEENKSEDVTYVINRIVVNDTIEISEYENYSLNVTRNTLAPTIKVMCGDEELINDANKVSNDNIELNVKAVDNNGDELISADDDSKNYKVEYLSLKDNGEEMAEKPEIRENTDKGGFDIVLPKKNNETHKYELTVNVKELVWGNSGKISVTAVIDNAIPKIKVNEKSSDNSGKRVFEVTVTDDRDLYSDFEADKDSLNNLLSVLDDNESAVTDADISAEAGAGNNIVKYNVSINNDKVYSIKAKDLAGNESAITKLDAFELNDLKGLSETETTYIGKDGKVVSLTLSGEVSSVRWGIDNNAFSDISCDDNNKYEFNVGDKIAGIADANTHSVDIVITKEDGNTIEKKFNIIVDKDAPQFGDINNLYTEWTNSTSNPVSVNIKDNFNIEEISVYNVVGKIDKLDVKDKVDENSINIIKNADNDIEVSVLSNVIKDNSNIVFVACDKAGNKSTKSCYIKKDTNAPNGNISISEKEVWSDLINKDQITFGIYKNSKQAFKLGFADDASGVKEVYYFISKDKNIVSDLENVEWNSIKDRDIKNGNYSLEVSPVNSVIVYMKIIDNAGNVSYINSNGVVIDNVMNVSITDEDDKVYEDNAWSSAPKTIKISMKASISGFESYRIEKIIKDENGNDKVEKTYEEYRPEFIWNNNGIEERTVLIGADKTDNSTKGEYKMEEGDYQIRVTAKSRAGVESEKMVYVKYDKTVPEISIKPDELFDDTWVNRTNEKKACLNISVKDTLSGIKDISVYKNENKEDNLIKYDKKNESEISVSLDGLLENKDEATIIVTAYDNVGNGCNEKYTIKKDAEDPTGKISISEKEAWSDLINKDQITFGIYKNSKQAFKLGFADDASGVKEVYYFISKDKNIVSDLENVEWNSIKDRDIKNGNYSLEVSPVNSVIVYMKIIDNAGNVSYINSNGVVIDNVMDIKINDKSTGKEYENGWISQNEHKTIEIKMNASISGFKSYKIEKIIKDESGNDKVEKTYEEYEPEYISNNNGTEERTVLIGTDKIDNSEKGEYKMEEGDYQIRVTAKSRAGVESEKMVYVKYDKTLPNIENKSSQAEKDEDKIPDKTTGWINKSKLDKYLCFSITDDHLNSVEFYLKENGKETKISPSVEKNEYKFAVKDLPDGKYTLEITATDEAENNSTLNVPINKDTKPLEINISKLSEQWNNKKLNFDLDNDHIDGVVTSGIEKVEAYKVKYFENFIAAEYTYKENQKIAIELNEGKQNAQDLEQNAKSWNNNKIDLSKITDGKYYIVVIAYDYAGNKTISKTLIQNDNKKSNISFKFSDSSIKDGEWIGSKNKNKKLKIEITDKNKEIPVSGIKNVDIYKYYSQETLLKKAKENFKRDLNYGKESVVRIVHDDEVYNNWYEKKISLSNGHYYIVVSTTDNAGNEAIELKEIKKDTNPGIIKLKSNLNLDSEWINVNTQKEDANLKISLSDKDKSAKGNNIASSGIRSVKIYRSLYSSDQKQQLDEDLEDPLTYIKNNRDDYVAIAQDKYTYNVITNETVVKTAEMDLDLKKIPDGKYFVIVVMEDSAGNVTCTYKSIMKDTNCPKEVSKNISKTEFGWISKKSIENGSCISFGCRDNYVSASEVYEYQIPSSIKSIKFKIGDKELKYTTEEIENGKKTIISTDEIIKIPDGDYYINYTITDEAENTTEGKIRVKKDTSSPNGGITLESVGDWNLGWNSEPLFEKFSNKSLKFSLSYNDKKDGVDNTSGVKEAWYYVTKDMNSVVANTEKISDDEWTKIYVNNNKNEFTVPIGDNENVDAVIYVKLKDGAGNETYMRSNGITIDHYAPEAMAAGNDEPIISIDVASSDIGQDGIYKSAPVINYDIQDKEYNNVYSGLQEIIYTVTNEDTGVTTGKITVDGVNDGVTRNPEYRGSINLSSLGETVYNGNNITVQITAKDNAENEYKPSSKSLSIDTTKPTVNVTYKDSTGAEVEPNGRYFNNDITMVVTVTERNFDADDTLFRINGQQISLNGMTLVGDAPAGGNGDGDTHTYEYRFTGDEANDKDYTVEYVSCTDKAGNASDSVITPQTFTVDKVQPTVSANDAAGYSSSALTYTATVTERNFDEAGAKVLVTKRLNGSLSYENREYPVIWSTSGDTHTAALSFAEDGDYSFTITCTDKAGNQQAAVYTSKEFTVDNVDPVLTSNISEENNNIANKGNIDFEYVYTDINSSNESGMIGYKVRTLAGTAVNDWVPEIKNVNVDGVNGYTIKFHDNATATKLKDGIYTIELTVKDKAGREAKDEKQFSVNRHGSAYSYISSSYTGAVILQQYVKEITDDIEVVVMNCDDITQYQVEVWNSLNEQNILKPDEDYTWKKENSGYVYKEDNSNRESGFTMYSCKIKPEVFSNEGTYTVRVSTKDIADDAAYGDNASLLYNDDTNTDNNMDITTNMDAAQADKIEFTVDRTNPEIVIMDIDNNGKYNLDKKFSFDYADANELDDIKFVRKDGDKVLETITYKPSDLKDLKTGNISAVAKEYDGYQTITISATDKAGNTGSASVKVLVTSNLWIKYINNTPLVVATIVVVVAAAGGIFFVLFRRRRRGEQN